MEIINHKVFGDIMKVNDNTWVKGMKICFLGKERKAILVIKDLSKEWEGHKA